MPLLIPIQDEGLFVQRYAARLCVDVTRKAEAKQVNLSADIAAGEGTIAFIDVISEILDAAR